MYTELKKIKKTEAMHLQMHDESSEASVHTFILLGVSIFRYLFRQARGFQLNPTGKRQLTNYNVVVEGGNPAYLSPPARAPRKLETPRPPKRNFTTTSKLSKSFAPTTYIGESLLILSIAFNPGLFCPPLTQILRFHSGVRTPAFVTSGLPILTPG